MSQHNQYKEYLTPQIRTIALIGHGGSGKTSFSEASLFSTGAINRQGKIEDGNTVSDYHPDEVERKISINTSLLTTDVNGIKINLLDTPGYTDFTGEVNAALRVSDTAVTFVKGFEGVEVGTEIVWKYVKEYGLPSMFVVTRFDADKTDFDAVVASIKERCSNDAVLITFPARQGVGANAVIDVLRMKQLVFAPNGNGKYTEEDVPADLKEKASHLHEELIEKIAESDEAMLDKFFSNGTLNEEDIKKGLHKGLVDRKIYPIFAAGAAANVGVLNVLEFISSYCPPPNELVKVPATDVNTKKQIEVQVSDSLDTSMFVFKTVSEHHVGELSLFKVYTGTVTPGLDLVNEANGKPERLGQIYVMNGRERKEVAKLHAGDIGAAVKLKDTHTNNTLSSKSFPVTYTPINFPEPVITCAIQSKSKGDEDKIGSALHTLHEEDPTFVYKVDGEIKQTVVSGQGELHLMIIIKRLKEKFGVDVDLIEPRIPFRETIRGMVADAEFKHKKQSGGRGQYGHVHLKVEPKPRGTGFEFEDAVVGGVVPGRFIPAVEKGVNDSLENGVIAGYKVVDVKVTLFDGSYHDVDSDEMSFKIAASQAFRKGFKEAKPILLEPIYEVEVTVPEEYMGDVMGDLSSRRGKIAGMDSDGLHQIIKATVPLKELFKYSTTLRSMTQGRGIHRQKFSSYDEVPREVADKIIQEYEKQKHGEE
ncbi:MAG: elongation factor G [Ignavibacteriales bacterium]|nr:elongation factor G [Ignavibacteriales bacterium]